MTCFIKTGFQVAIKQAMYGSQMMGTIRPVLSKQDFRITLQRKLLIINVQCNADLHNIMFTQYLLHTHYLQ